MCDLSPDANTVTSVSWNERGNLVAVGTHHGYVTVWDVAASKQVCIFNIKINTSKSNSYGIKNYSLLLTVCCFLKNRNQIYLKFLNYI